MSSTKKRRSKSSSSLRPKPSPAPVSVAKTQVPSAAPATATTVDAPNLALAIHSSLRFYGAACGVLLLGIFLRQVVLGHAPFHPDESIHAYYSQGFQNYHYDPVFHGPLLYHLTSFIFAIGGETDYTARLMPSLMGILLLVMVLFPARRWLGNRGALAAAGMLAVSTSVVTYSRHLLHDAQSLVLTLGAVLCLAAMWDNPSSTVAGRNARLGLAAFLTLFLATKANCFFVMVMLLAFAVAWHGAGRITLPESAARWVPPLCFLVVSLGAVTFPTAFLHIGMPNIAPSPNHAVFQLIALGSCAWLWLWLLTRTPDATEGAAKREWRLHSEPTAYLLALAVALWLYVFLYGNGAQVLQQWAQHRAFPTDTFRAGMQSAYTAIGKMLNYWGGQQKSPRLPGRHDYYIVLALLYEVPIVLAVLGGIWHYAKNRSAWTDLLLWWGFTSWAVYAVANEKVPWLLVHMMLPFALLGGMWLGQLRLKTPVWAVLMTLGLVFSLRGDVGTVFQRAGDNAEPILYAQTSDKLRDAINNGLLATRGKPGRQAFASGKDWPSVWYFRKTNPLTDGQGYVLSDLPALNDTRIMVGRTDKDDHLDEKDKAFSNVEYRDETLMRRAGWDVQTVDFLIWTRASWEGLRPDRYWHWWWTRDTLPLSERNLDRKQWKISILSGQGEWSHAEAVVGYKR